MALKINNPKNLIFTQNTGVNYRFTATGGKKPYSWKAIINKTYSLPAGLKLTKEGVLKGKPTKTKTTLVSIKVKDYKGNIKSKIFNITIVAPLEITNPKNLTFTKNTAVKYNFTAIGGKKPYSWKAITSLPIGLTLTDKGLLKGIPTKIKKSSINIQVKDYKGSIKSKIFNINIISPVITTTTIAPTTTATPTTTTIAPTTTATPTTTTIAPSGSLWNWGGNIIGEIGDNTTNPKSSPVQTIAYGTNWMKISYEINHIASIKNDGTLWLWGYNSYGQLGDNTNTNRSSPIQTIAYGTNWKQVSCGQKHTAAIKTDGTLWTWGINNFGCLGDNTVTTRSSPVQTVTFGNNWMQVCCGYSITAAIKTDGTLWLWGKNSNGQLGDNTILPKSSPIQTITYGSNWKQIALSSVFADQNYCGAVKNDGTLWMWGWNISGNLGDNTTVSKSSPIQTISYGTNWKQIDIGANFTGAIKTDGTLWLWGQGVYGELGDNTAIQRSSPVQTIAYGTNWKKVVCGSNISAAIKTDGTLWCWGSNGGGQLGDNTIISKSSPVQTVSGGTNWIDVACGSYNVSGIKS